MLVRTPDAAWGARVFPSGKLARIDVPTTLVWGRHDRANRLEIAESASTRIDWSLHVIEDAADDPARDRPDASVRRPMTQEISFETYSSAPAANYERYFVPAIGAPLADDLVELAELRSGERVLDVACGTGVVARLAAERVGGSAVVGIDANPGMLDVARTAVPDPAIEWQQANAESIPLGDATFDVVLCQMGLQFFPDKQRALGEMRRVLEPGGRVVLNVPGPTPPVMAVLEQALKRYLGPEAAGFVAVVFSLHEPDDVRALLQAAGLTDLHARSEKKKLRLPGAVDFLWQYVYSTPLAQAAETLDEERRAGLQQEFVTGSAPFVEDGGLALDLDVTSAVARRP